MPDSLPSTIPEARATIGAAAYLRKSSNLQEYSFENQMRVIADYAQLRNIEIVRVYQDAGRSGISMRKRTGLRQLLEDAKSKPREFSMILVYDLSRWGRFQDIDEGAHLEFTCRQAGVAVEYCAEGFQNDGSILADLMKGLKRTMAAEFSRELSGKIFRAQARLAKSGFLVTGSAGFGLRRMLVDRNGQQKGLMLRGQQKYFATDRVILVPGPRRETQAVREVFRLFAEEAYSTGELAEFLNKQGFRTIAGRLFSSNSILDLLRNERYIGTLTYNRSSVKLGSSAKLNSKDTWVRAEGAISPIVSSGLFAKAQASLTPKTYYSDRDILDSLTAIWCVKGQLMAKDIDAFPCSPTIATIRARFGTLDSVKRRLGYAPTHLYSHKEFANVLRAAERRVISELLSLNSFGERSVYFDPTSQMLVVPGRHKISIVIVTYGEHTKFRLRGWRLMTRRIRVCDFAIVVRIDERRTDNSIRDIHMLPSSVVPTPSITLTDRKFADLRQYRLRRFSDFHAMVRRAGEGRRP